jgi:hypothetical protein
MRIGIACPLMRPKSSRKNEHCSIAGNEMNSEMKKEFGALTACVAHFQRRRSAKWPLTLQSDTA